MDKKTRDIIIIVMAVIIGYSVMSKRSRIITSKEYTASRVVKFLSTQGSSITDTQGVSSGSSDILNLY